MVGKCGKNVWVGCRNISVIIIYVGQNGRTRLPRFVLLLGLIYLRRVKL